MSSYLASPQPATEISSISPRARKMLENDGVLPYSQFSLSPQVKEFAAQIPCELHRFHPNQTIEAKKGTILFISDYISYYYIHSMCVGRIIFFLGPRFQIISKKLQNGLV